MAERAHKMGERVVGSGSWGRLRSGAVCVCVWGGGGARGWCIRAALPPPPPSPSQPPAMRGKLVMPQSSSCMELGGMGGMGRFEVGGLKGVQCLAPGGSLPIVAQAGLRPDAASPAG